MEEGLPARALGIEGLAVGAVLLVVAAGGIVVIASGHTLGWDESVYAVWARSLVTEAPMNVVGVFRPPGLAVLGVLSAPAGFADAVLRLIGLSLGLLALVGVWALARVVFRRRTAFLALLVASGSAVVLQELPQFHNDLGAAGLLLLLMALLWRQLEDRPRPSALLLVAAPLAGGAFYLRYGTMPAIAAIGVTAAVLWLPHVRRSPVLVAATVGITAILLVPHAIAAVTMYGRPWGILAAASDQVNTSSPLASALDYLRFLPRQMAGRVGAVSVVIAVLVVIVLVVRRVSGREPHPSERGVAWLLVPAAIATGATTAFSHAEARYLVFPMLLAVIVGAHGVWLGFDAIVARRGERRGNARLARFATVAVLAVAAVFTAVSVRRAAADQARDPDGWTPYRTVSSKIASEAHKPCVVATTLWPIVSWYSGCSIVGIDTGSLSHLREFDAHSRWMLLTSEDAERAPTTALEQVRGAVGGRAPLGRAERGSSWAEAWEMNP